MKIKLKFSAIGFKRFGRIRRQMIHLTENVYILHNIRQSVNLMPHLNSILVLCRLEMFKSDEIELYPTIGCYFFIRAANI